MQWPRSIPCLAPCSLTERRTATTTTTHLWPCTSRTQWRGCLLTATWLHTLTKWRATTRSRASIRRCLAATRLWLSCPSTSTRQQSRSWSPSPATQCKICTIPNHLKPFLFFDHVTLSSTKQLIRFSEIVILHHFSSTEISWNRCGGRHSYWWQVCLATCGMDDWDWSDSGLACVSWSQPVFDVECGIRSSSSRIWYRSAAAATHGSWTTHAPRACKYSTRWLRKHTRRLRGAIRGQPDLVCFLTLLLTGDVMMTTRGCVCVCVVAVVHDNDDGDDDDDDDDNGNIIDMSRRIGVQSTDNNQSNI